MPRNYGRLFCLWTVIFSLILFFGCRSKEKQVVVYTSVDQVYSEPIFKSFEQKTGVKVLPVYDVEAAKTTGLVNRLIAEKERPQADVFWNNEFAQTFALKAKEVLAVYQSPAAADLPAAYIDPEGYWTGAAGRARVLLVNTQLLSPQEYPRSIFDLLKINRPADKIGIAYPLFGTTVTQAAALYAALGPEKGKEFYRQLKSRGVRVVDGNSVVRDLVAAGQLAVGLTDSDDACGAVKKGAPVAVIFPDQDGLGTLIIPGTVSLIARAPHAKEGQQLMDYLLSAQVERQLIQSGFAQMPLRPQGAGAPCLSVDKVKGMQVSLEAVYKELPRVQKELPEIFIR